MSAQTKAKSLVLPTDTLALSWPLIAKLVISSAPAILEYLKALERGPLNGFDDGRPALFKLMFNGKHGTETMYSPLSGIDSIHSF